MFIHRVTEAAILVRLIVDKNGLVIPICRIRDISVISLAARIQAFANSIVCESGCTSLRSHPGILVVSDLESKGGTMIGLFQMHLS
jgi:hypothetical protein